MSEWTHLAGLIRLDSMGSALVRGPFDVKQKKIMEAVAKALGNTCDYDSPSESWDQCSVPQGSEGSLQYKVYPNSDKEEPALSWGYVAIWSDLRDFGTDDYPKVLEWFQKSLERLMQPEGFRSPETMSMEEKLDYALASFAIRDAVLSVHTEYNHPKILTWDSDLKKVVEHEITMGIGK